MKKRRQKSCSKTFEWSNDADVFFKSWLELLDEKPAVFKIFIGQNLTVSAKAKINGNACVMKRVFKNYGFNPSVLNRQPTQLVKALLSIVGEE